MTEKEKKILKEAMEKVDYDEINKYHMESNFCLSESSHRFMVGRAMKLVRLIGERGGTAEEIQEAINYFGMTVDAMKKRLNWRKYEADHKIAELFDKYGRDKYGNPMPINLTKAKETINTNWKEN